MGTRYNRLAEAVLTSTYNLFFWAEIWKISEFLYEILDCISDAKFLHADNDDSWQTALKNRFIWASAWQNLLNGMCAQGKLKSAWASVQSDRIPMSAQRRLWSDWADVQADLSLRLAHMLFCWFCHALAHLSLRWAHMSKVSFRKLWLTYA